MRVYLAIFVLAGCAGTTTKVATGLQPHPRTVRPAADALPSSQELYIYTPVGEYVRVQNSAQLVAVTPDLVRVHIGVGGRTASLHVWLEDEEGRRYEPVSREAARTERLVVPWWRVSVHGPRNRFQDNAAEVYFSRVDYVFRSPGLMGIERKSLAVILQEGDAEMRYEWTFGGGYDIRHHQHRTTDAQRDIVVVPGPAAVRMATWIEPETYRYVDSSPH